MDPYELNLARFSCDSVVVFRIYQSTVRNGRPYIVKLDVGKYRETASKIAEDLGLELVG